MLYTHTGTHTHGCNTPKNARKQKVIYKKRDKPLGRLTKKQVRKIYEKGDITIDTKEIKMIRNDFVAQKANPQPMVPTFHKGITLSSSSATSDLAL